MSEESEPALTTAEMLRKLGEPFPASSVEWRVSHATPWGPGVRAWVFAYLTARAIHQRLDDVCGPENWCNTPQIVSECKPGVLSVQVGISIRINGEWITKYNVSEASGIEPAKGAFSGAEKRAGEEWGIGRQLWYLKEQDAETTRTDPNSREWRRATLKSDKTPYWWKEPELPSWCLPKVAEEDRDVTDADINALKKRWRKLHAPRETNRKNLAKGFAKWVSSMLGDDFPIDECSCWTMNMLSECNVRLDLTTHPSGPTPDVPFD